MIFRPRLPISQASSRLWSHLRIASANTSTLRAHTMEPHNPSPGPLNTTAACALGCLHPMIVNSSERESIIQRSKMQRTGAYTDHYGAEILRIYWLYGMCTDS